MRLCCFFFFFLAGQLTAFLGRHDTSDLLRLLGNIKPEFLLWISWFQKGYFWLSALYKVQVLKSWRL